MPNWVYNNVSVSGTKQEVADFVAKATALHPESHADGKVIMTTEPEFSFWNFIRPPQNAVDSGEYFGTNGWADGEKLGDTPTNWYNWNNENWNTKWDANEVGLEVSSSINADTASVSINFSTAWSIPEPVLNAMTEQHPTLTFQFSCEEETGWGAEFIGENGKFFETKSWSEPNSHADYVERDNIDGCMCSYSDDEEDWYDDCPRDEKEFVVVLERTYKITARDAEHAWELALDENTTLTEHTDQVAWVKDETGKRIYPTLD